MKVLKRTFGFLTLLTVVLSTGALTGNPASQNIINSLGNAVGMGADGMIFIATIPIALISLLTSAYFGGVMSVYVKEGDEARHVSEFGLKNIASHPEALTPAGLSARTEMAQWSVILAVALVGILLGFIH